MVPKRHYGYSHARNNELFQCRYVTMVLTRTYIISLLSLRRTDMVRVPCVFIYERGNLSCWHVGRFWNFHNLQSVTTLAKLLHGKHARTAQLCNLL
ncbi:hypothetical protein NDU88_008169 [Pleurodeles waltl]|uniref:Uncharacterized protein n=1 Tax=Pleurodeles waltl TaxID=8319 RepID=A0AAV7N8X9_PLEWA|nr:hypothetical protein NDU88_008169 [Pleurodeles waltl]